MKIVSPFRDYYDSAMAYGQDPARVYERGTRTRIIPDNVWPYSRAILRRLEEIPRSNDYADVHRAALLLFCGSAWPVFYHQPQGQYRTRATFAEDLPRRVASSRLYPDWREHYAGLLASPDREEREDAKEFFLPESERQPGRDRRVIRDATMRRLHEAFVGVEVGTDLLVGESAPAALLHIEPSWGRGASEIAIVTNPRLADLGFQRIMDAYTCFQTIETFLGSQLAPPDLAPQRVG